MTRDEGPPPGRDFDRYGGHSPLVSLMISGGFAQDVGEKNNILRRKNRNILTQIVSLTRGWYGYDLTIDYHLWLLHFPKNK